MDIFREVKVFHEAERLDVFWLLEDANDEWRNDKTEYDDTDYELPFFQLLERKAKMWMGNAGDCDYDCDEN